jgi:hypothetical protein
VLEAAGVPPNDSTNSHQAVAILERLGFKTLYAGRSSGQQSPAAVQSDNSWVDRPIAETLLEIAKQADDSDWARVPTDLSKNIDHYLYGGRKSNR